MADDVEYGRVVDTTLGEPDGTELVADAAVGATSLVVDYAMDFEESGMLLLDGTQLAYTEVVAGEGPDDPDTFTLAEPLAVAASTDAKVSKVAGGVPVEEWLLHVDLGDGHPVDIPIPFEQRALWSSIDVALTPVPVVISADLTQLLEVPGRAAAIDQTAIRAPTFSLRLSANQSIPAGGGTTVLTAWQGESGTDDNNGETGGAPSGGGGWYRGDGSDFRWASS